MILYEDTTHNYKVHEYGNWIPMPFQKLLVGDVIRVFKGNKEIGAHNSNYKVFVIIALSKTIEGIEYITLQPIEEHTHEE